jgi:two-component system, chemotaxis family, sensor kinase CheA
MDMSQYMEIFIEESKEHLQNMNSIMLELEKDSSDLGMLNELFRIAHTIKGMSGTMGFTKIANLTHEMENVLHLVRNKEIVVTSKIIDILFECFDTLEGFISSLEATGEENNVNAEPLTVRLSEMVRTKGVEDIGAAPAPAEADATEASIKESKCGGENIEDVGVRDELQDERIISRGSLSYFNIEIDGMYLNVVKEAINQGMNALLIRVDVSPECMLKAARAFIVFNTLEQYGEIISSYPSAEDIEGDKFGEFFEVLYLTKLDERAAENEISNISEIRSVTAVRIENEEVLAMSEREMKASVREIMITPDMDDEAIRMHEVKEDHVEDHEEEHVELDKLLEQLEKKVAHVSDEHHMHAEKEDDKTHKGGDKQKTAKTVRVDIDRLDNLMNLVSELIIIKTRLEDHGSNAHSNTSEAIEYLERITTSLHDAVMKVRMVPVERTFNRFPRMVRDLAKDLGKGIKLLMSGEETEVDRTVIDEIGDPLIHLIRNSIDHGIESPEARIEKGKVEYGTVNLRAYPDGNTVVIEVEDDGNGLDPDKILSKALSKGVITEKDVDVMTPHDIVNLIFKPGFSTAEKVTDLSGRGVGLDVVKTKIESLNGTVEVKSQVGKGSKFTIRLPLTLAIIQALMVNLGTEKYALPLNNIKEITTISKRSISMVQDQEVVLYRNKTLPLLRLGDILHVNQKEIGGDNLVVVVVRKGEVEAGLIVDTLIGQQEIVIKSLGKYLTGVKVIAGATILGNGGVALIVDPNQLL